MTPQRKRAVEEVEHRTHDKPNLKGLAEVAIDGWERAIVAEGVLRQNEKLMMEAAQSVPEFTRLAGELVDQVKKIRSFLSAEGE